MCQENLALNTRDHNELRYHNFGSKPGKLLSYLIIDTHAPVSISKMKNEKEESVTEPKAISNVFKQYYKQLYNKPTGKLTDMKDFLDSIELPHITEEQKQLLNAPITKRRNRSND